MRGRSAFPFHAIPLALAVGAAVWFLLQPGFARLFLALLAFGAWASAWAIETLIRSLARGKDQLGKLVDQVHRQLDPDAASRGDRSDLPAEKPYVELWDRFERLPHGLEARRQLLRLGRSFGHFEALLQARLNPGELTHERYLGSARQVRDLVLGQLGEAALQLRAGAAGNAAGKERARELLAGNETALVELERINVAIADMGEGSRAGRARELEDAIGDLAELAARAGKYRS